MKSNAIHFGIPFHRLVFLIRFVYVGLYLNWPTIVIMASWTSLFYDIYSGVKDTDTITYVPLTNKFMQV